MAQNEMVQRPSGQLIESPSFMDADKNRGTELVLTKIRPPFLKIVQKQSDQNIIDQFGIGAVIQSPDNILIIEPKGEPVRIVPIFFFIEYMKLSPIALKGQEFFIRERTVDSTSDLARRAMDVNLWYEDHPEHPPGTRDFEKYRYRNCEAYSFICCFEEPHLPNLPFVLGFMKGSYGKGQQFCNLISMRRPRPIFGSVFSLSVDPVLGKNPAGEWMRYLTTNPPERPWVADEQQYVMYRELHTKMQEMHDSRLIETDYEDPERELDEQAGADSYR